MPKTSTERQREYREKHGIAHKPAKTCVCQICNQKFVVARPGPVKFCSKECAVLHAQILQRESVAKRVMSTMIKTCEFCGHEFKIGWHQESKKFCSLQCRKLAMRKSIKTNECIVCGNSHNRKAQTCGDVCYHKLLQYRMYQISKEYECDRDIKEAKRTAKQKLKEKNIRPLIAKMLKAYRKCGSCEQVASLFSKSASETNRLLNTSKAYKKRVNSKRNKSTWRIESLRVGSLSKLFRYEKDFQNAVVLKLRECGVIVEQEVFTSKKTNRKIDLVVHSLFGRFGVECKNGNKTSDADQCLGQAVLKSALLNIKPVCCFPSDCTPDAEFFSVCSKLGVVVCNENNITERIFGEVNETIGNVHSFHPAH